MDRRLLCPRLVGREAELERFDTLLEGLPLGAGATLLVSGEAGIGKSALLRELARHAAARGIPLLSGECTVIEARRAFGPLAEILDAAMNRSVGGITAEWLSRTLPDLARLRGDPRLSDGPVRQREEAERFRVHSGFARFFRTLAARTPLVLVVDDLQWGDEATLELIPFLSAKLRETPLLIVAAHRPSDAADSGGLAAAIAALERDRLSETMTLGPLARADIARVVDSTVGLRGAAAVPLLDALEACEGNPFFVEEVLVGLAASGDLVQRDGRWEIARTLSGPTVPRSVRAAVQQRMRGLDPQVQRVLGAAAVIGQRFDPELLQRVTGVSEPELIAVLRAALAAELIVELADGPAATYAFRHALTREAVLADLLKPEQRRLHALIGEQLEGADGAHPEDLAHHFDAAGDRVRAARYHERAADAAVELVAVEAARRHLDRCVALVPVDDPHRIDLLLRLSRAASDTSDRPAAIRSGEEAYRQASALDDRMRMARALLALCPPRFQLGDTETAQRELDEAFTILEPLGDTPELARACFDRSYRAFGEGDVDGAVDWGRRAVRIARAVGDRGTEVFALSFVGVGLALRGDPEGFATARGAAALAVEHGFVLTAIRTYLNLPGLLRPWNAPPEETASALACARELAERHGWRGDRLVAAEAAEAFEDGRWDEALRLASQITGSAFLAWTGMLMAFMQAARHGPAAGLPLLDDPRRRLLAAGTPLHVLDAARASETMLLAGDARSALELAEPAVALVDGVSQPRTQDAITVCAIVAAGHAGDRGRRERWLELAIRVQRAPERPGVRARRAFALAERAADAGDLDSAIATQEEQADLFERSFDRFPWTQTQLRRVEFLVRRGGAGDAERAASVFAAVVPYWRKAGAAWYLARLRTWAAGRGVPFPRETRARTGSATGATGLTPREREVAALIAAGMTNRQIAERLVIAERTAEGHVERIREKLSFNSRTEIATWFTRTVAGPGGAA